MTGDVPRGLRPLTDDVWLHEGTIRFTGFRLHRRMTVIRLRDGRLFLHSPNPPSRELKKDLEALGVVAFLIVPSAIHGHGAQEMSRAFPDAQLLVAPGTQERRRKLAIDGVLTERPADAWTSELDQAILRGNSLCREVVFLHRPSRTLLVTDLVENLKCRHLSPFGCLVAAAFGLLRRPSCAPEHTQFLDDPDAAEPALRRIREWDFDRIVMCHGDIIETDAKAVLDQVVTRMLRSARRAWSPVRPLLRPVAELFWLR